MCELLAEVLIVKWSENWIFRKIVMFFSFSVYGRAYLKIKLYRKNFDIFFSSGDFKTNLSTFVEGIKILAKSAPPTTSFIKSIRANSRESVLRFEFYLKVISGFMIVLN